MRVSDERLVELQQKGQQQIAAAKAVADKYNGRDAKDWSQNDLKAYGDAMDEARGTLALIKQAKNDRQVFKDVEELGRIGGPGSSTSRLVKTEAMPHDDGQRLNLKRAGSSAGRRMAEHMAGGQKALAPGLSAIVAQEFNPDPIALGQVANSLLDILPTENLSTEFSYLVQIARNNNAAVVPDGEEKPESQYELERKQASLQTIAHVSEPVSKYWLVDNERIEHFLADELEYGLRKAICEKVIADLNAASGHQTQAFSGSVLQTLRKTLTKLQAVGLEPSAFVLNPTNWEEIELGLTTTSAVEYRGLPYDPVARRLWGVPVVVDFIQAAGVSHTLAKGAITLATDGQVDVEWSKENEDMFKKNLLIARCETRMETAVFRPYGVVKGDLTA